MNSQSPDAESLLNEFADDRRAVLTIQESRDVGGVIPRSGCIQQPGVAAQRRTPGKRLINRLYAEGVPQFCTRSFNPTRTFRQTRHCTFETDVSTHPETSPFGDAPADSVCNPSRRPHGKGLLKRHRNLAAIETWQSSVSTTSRIRVSILVPDRRLATFSKADRECGCDPQRHRSVVTGCRDYGRHLPGTRGVQIASPGPSETASGALSKIRCAGRPARVTGPWRFHSGLEKKVWGNCRTPSAYKLFGNDDLGCAAARRPQANGCNRFAVLSVTVGEALSV